MSKAPEVCKAKYKFEDNEFDYSRGKIYKVTSKNTDKIFIGCTINSLENRIYNFEVDYENYLANKDYYVEVFEVMKHGDYSIELIENYSCSTGFELQKKECEHIRKNRLICVNSRLPRRNKQDHIDDVLNGLEDKFFECCKDYLCEDGIKKAKAESERIKRTYLK